MNKYIFGLLINLVLSINANAGIVYESATGSFDPAGCCGGFSISSTQFIGSVFSITEPTKVDGIGGHFNNIPASDSFASFLGLGGPIFGAIVNLGGDGLPSGNLTNVNNVIAFSVFTPNSGVDSLTSISATLPTGTYGLVFGSGLFGATGKTTLTLIQPNQAVTSNGKGVALGAPSFPQWNFMEEMSGSNRYRMYVTGSAVTTVPEPETYAMLLAGLGLTGGVARRRKAKLTA